MVEQHFYARGSRGYGTAAHSRGLTQEIMKRCILPYCVYPAGGKGKYLTLVHFPCGRMLVGQAVKNGRSFFQHNYLVDARGVKDALACVPGVKFETDCAGCTPRVLDALPAEVYPAAACVDVGASVALAARAVAEDKMVCVVVPRGGGHDFVLGVLAALYARLALAARHLLGFCSGGALRKRGVHLIFTDDPCVAANTGDFLVDFTEKTRIMEPPDFFALKYGRLSDARFCETVFADIDFWLARAPEVLLSEGFRGAVRGRLAQLLGDDAPSAARLAAMSEGFLRRGMSGRYADIIGFGGAEFLLRDILRRTVHDKVAPDLDCYRLRPDSRARVEKVLESEAFAHVAAPSRV